MLRILPCIPQCFHILHVGSCSSIWKTLQTSLQVLILHPRHHSSTGTLVPFLLGYFFITRRLCINDVAQQCRITTLCLIFLLFLKVFSYYSSSWILSSLVLRNKSTPSFLVGNCTRSFLQVKCISCMVINIS